jgi:peptidylprolyl isomerase
MKQTKSNNCYKTRLQRGVTLLLLIFSLSFNLLGWNLEAYAANRKSALPSKNAVTDPEAILRYALPIDNPKVRELQGNLEDIFNQIKRKRWNLVSRDVKSAASILSSSSDKLLASIPEESQENAQILIKDMNEEMSQLQAAVESQDKQKIIDERSELLSKVGQLEQLMVQGFPFVVPEEYANLPQLKGRAIVEIETNKGNLTVVVDGYNAPVNAGNFIDLVNRGFYNGLPFTRGGDDFVVQSGDPQGSADGFVDPKTKQYRAIPLEVYIRGEQDAIYGSTLEDLGIYLADLTLPFNAYGAVALARPEEEPNGGSSQFFFFKFDNELTPPGFNLMDGRYSVFGYVVKGKEVLRDLTDKDKIISAKVVDGLNNLTKS